MGINKSSLIEFIAISKIKATNKQKPHQSQLEDSGEPTYYLEKWQIWREKSRTF